MKLHVAWRTLLLPCLVLGLSGAAPVPPAAGQQAVARRESSVPRLYTASGSSSETDLARLRASVEKLAGITRV